jgi:hypothetical protein
MFIHNSNSTVCHLLHQLRPSTPRGSVLLAPSSPTMWSKISNALKSHPHIDPSSSQSTSANVMDKIYEQHPNLSVFHNSDDSVPFPAPTNSSPPPSPTKNKRTMFKRISKMPRDDDENARPASPMRLAMGIPKKVKSSLNLMANGKLSSSRC